MTNYHDIPELLEKYMDTCGTTERWITASEFRTHFQLDRTMTSTISGFLRRISLKPYFYCPFIVVRIEKVMEYSPQPHPVNRYYVKKRQITPKNKSCPSRGTGDGAIACTENS